MYACVWACVEGSCGDGWGGKTCGRWWGLGYGVWSGLLFGRSCWVVEPDQLGEFGIPGCGAGPACCLSPAWGLVSLVQHGAQMSSGVAPGPACLRKVLFWLSFMAGWCHAVRLSDFWM